MIRVEPATRHVSLAMRIPIALALLVLASLVASPARAAADQALLDNVRQFLATQARGLGDDVTVTLHPPAARFPTCHSPEPFLPSASQPPIGRVSVGIKCGEQGRRTRFMQAEVSVIGAHLETAQDIAAGETLTRDHLVIRHGDLARLPRQTIRDIGHAIGRVAMRPLSEGLVLQRYQLRKPRLVNRGDNITLEAQGEGFRVTRSAEALAPGGRGDRIRVRLENREVLDARVIGERRLVVDN